MKDRSVVVFGTILRILQLALSHFNDRNSEALFLTPFRYFSIDFILYKEKNICL